MSFLDKNKNRIRLYGDYVYLLPDISEASDFPYRMVVNDQKERIEVFVPDRYYAIPREEIDTERPKNNHELIIRATGLKHIKNLDGLPAEVKQVVEEAIEVHAKNIMKVAKELNESSEVAINKERTRELVEQFAAKHPELELLLRKTDILLDIAYTEKKFFDRSPSMARGEVRYDASLKPTRLYVGALNDPTLLDEGILEEVSHALDFILALPSRALTDVHVEKDEQLFDSDTMKGINAYYKLKGGEIVSKPLSSEAQEWIRNFEKYVKHFAFENPAVAFQSISERVNRIINLPELPYNEIREAKDDHPSNLDKDTEQIVKTHTARSWLEDHRKNGRDYFSADSPAVEMLALFAPEITGVYRDHFLSKIRSTLNEEGLLPSQEKDVLPKLLRKCFGNEDLKHIRQTLGAPSDLNEIGSPVPGNYKSILSKTPLP